MEVNHDGLPAEAAVLAQEGGVHEERVGRPQGAVSTMYVTENVESWQGTEDRLQKLWAAFPALLASAMVQDGKRRTVRNQDVQALGNPRPVALPVFRL